MEKSNFTNKMRKFTVMIIWYEPLYLEIMTILLYFFVYHFLRNPRLQIIFFSVIKQIYIPSSKILIYELGYLEKSSKFHRLGNQSFSSDIIFQLYNRTQKIIIYHDVYVGFLGIIIYKQDLIIFSPQLQFIPDFDFSSPKVIGNLETVILLCHRGIGIFGHFFLDFLLPLTFFPPKIIQKSFFIGIPKNPLYIKEGIKFFNISNEQLLIQKKDEFFFSKNVYTLDPWPHIFLGYFPVKKLRQIVFSHFQLKNSSQEIIGIYNRKQGRRSIINFLEIKKQLENNWPNINFTIIPDSPTLFESASLFNRIKIVWVGFHGSIFCNILFMSENSTYIEIETGSPHKSAAFFCLALNIHYFVTKLSYIVHLEFKDYYVDQKIVINLFQEALKLYDI